MIQPHYTPHAYLAAVRRTLLLVLVTLGVVGTPASAALAQHAKPASALVFDGVTVIDVEHGTRLSAQRVVVTGTRITAVGPQKKVAIPAGAKVVNAKGKYMIPGLWDLHIHPGPWGPVFYPLFLANGVLGVRDAASAIPLETLRMWRQEVLTGARPGPSRIFFSGPAISEAAGMQMAVCDRSQLTKSHMTCVGDEADARHLVDSLKAAGANMIKTYALTRSVYYAIASEARRVGLPFGGHLSAMTAAEAADSGATLLDHLNSAGGLDTTCVVASWIIAPNATPASFARCQSIPERLARNNTWFVPTVTIAATMGLPGARIRTIMQRAQTYLTTFWSDSAPAHTGSGNWLHGPVQADTLHLDAPDSIGTLRIAQKAGLPMVTGVDANGSQLKTLAPGFSVHQELAALVAEGLTTLNALQAATLNPAKAFRMTDSLGTVAAGKLADLVVLDADPLVDITNTTTIQAVVANGRYYDRAALDQVLQDVRTSEMGKRLLREANQ